MRSAPLGLALAALAFAPAARADAPAAPAPASAAPVAPPAPAPTLTATPPGVERLTLPRAVERALARNPTVQVATHDVARVEAVLRQVRAASLPQLTATGTLTRLDDERRLGERVAAAREQVSANVTLSAPLVAPRSWMAWSRAKDDVTTARASGDDVRRQVAVTTARAYLAVVSQRRVVEVGERARDTARAHLAFSSQREAAGLGNRIDVVRASIEVATTEAQLEAALAGLARAREALGVLVAGDAPVDAAEGADLAAAPAIGDALEGVEARTDLRAQRARVAAATRAARDDWADYVPQLTGVFQPFYQNPASLVQPLTGWQAQLILSVPLYDGGLRYGLADDRAARREQARAQLDGLLRQARSEVRVAADVARHAEATLGAARRAADLARQAFELADTAYKAGATTNLELIDAERRSRDAETAAVVAEDTARQARLDLLAASGRFP